MENPTSKVKYILKAVDQPLKQASRKIKGKKNVQSRITVINSQRINMKM